MKRTVVVKVCSMNGQKSRSKALKIVVGVSGVESATIKGQENDQIELTGDDIDAVAIMKLLRKKVGFAEKLFEQEAGCYTFWSLWEVIWTL